MSRNCERVEVIHVIFDKNLNSAVLKQKKRKKKRKLQISRVWKLSKVWSHRLSPSLRFNHQTHRYF